MGILNSTAMNIRCMNVLELMFCGVFWMHSRMEFLGHMMSHYGFGLHFPDE